jgi:hypothetical protein
MIIDLHHLSVNKAIRVFIEKYNKYYKFENQIEVIHGYGSSGQGGKIKKDFHKFLSKNKEFLTFEIGLNPGLTYIYPKKKLPSYESSLEKEILIFCKLPKSLSKIENKFIKKYSINEIKAEIKRLVKKEKLIESFKNSITTYQHCQ